MNVIRGLSSVLFLLALASVACAGEAIKAVRTAVPPVIDGRLDDECWGEAVPVSSFTIMNTNNPAEFKTEAYVLFDERNLYIGFRCHEPDVKNIKTEKRERDGAVFRDDCVEVMIDPWLSRDEYFHFGVNASGSIYDSFCSQGGHVHEPGWDGDWEAASHIGEDYWSAEIRIPFHTLEIRPGVGSSWGINLMREKKLPFPENSSIAGQGAFHIAGRFAVLEGLDVDFSKYCYEVGMIDKKMETAEGKLNTVFTVPVTNLTGKNSRLKLNCWLVDERDRVISGSAVMDLGAGDTAEADIGPMMIAHAGVYRMILSIQDAATHRTLKLQTKDVDIDFVPMAINVIEPFYRDAIFKTQNLDEVILDIEIRLSKEERSGKTLNVLIEDENRKRIISSPVISPVEDVNRVRFPVKELPHGNLFIHAVLEDSREGPAARTSRRIRKLPYKEGEVWLGRDLNWYVDGKPFLPIASWGLPEDTNEYYNVEWAQREGKKRVAFLYHSGHRNQLNASELGEDIINYTVRRVRENRDNPDLFGYHIADEPGGKFPVKNFEKLYGLIAEHDPYHPVIITHNSIPAFVNFYNSADSHSFHTYPPIYRDVRINDLSRVGIYADRFMEINETNGGRKSIGTLIQSFNYGDYGAVNNRIDTYQEFRTKLHMAVVRGAKGIIFFNRMFTGYPELFIGAPNIAREFDFLSEAVLAPVSELRVVSEPDSLKTLLKEVDGELYLFVVNESMEPVKARIEIGGIGRRTRTLQVVSENRRVRLRGDVFTDDFDVFETHVYTTYAGDTGLPSISEIEGKIAEFNNARRKPGNLAFQMFEGDGVEVSASSSRGAYRRPDNALWHLVDGVVSDSCRYNVLVWSDATPNEFPDWVEVKLPEENRIGRVVVYTPPLIERGQVISENGCLRDYEVQVFAGGEWKTVDAVRGNTGKVVENGFAQVVSDRVRIWITATNGAHSKISQIEIYEK